MYTIGVDLRALLTTPRTGVGEYTWELLSALFELDHINKYLLYSNSFNTKLDLPEFWKKPNIRFITSSYPNKLLNGTLKVFNRPLLDKLINKRSVKLTDQSLSKKIDFFFSPNLNFTALSSSVKYLLTIHDLSFKFFPEFFSKKQQYWHRLINPQKQCQKAFHIFTPSENTKQDLIKYLSIDEKKITAIYPGLSREFIKDFSEQQFINIKKQYALPQNFILFLGTIEPRKNILNTIQAFELAHQLLPMPYSLVIAGSAGWKNKKTYNYIQSSPVKDYIKIISYVNAKHKPYLYKLASLFVYPSFYEGFGFPVLEAMACGTPVITTNRSSLPELTEENAYLINPHQPTLLAKGIVTLLTNSTIKNYFIQKGLGQAKKFNWKKAAAEWLKALS